MDVPVPITLIVPHEVAPDEDTDKAVSGAPVVVYLSSGLSRNWTADNILSSRYSIMLFIFRV